MRNTFSTSLAAEAHCVRSGRCTDSCSATHHPVCGPIYRRIFHVHNCAAVPAICPDDVLFVPGGNVVPKKRTIERTIHDYTTNHYQPPHTCVTDGNHSNRPRRRRRRNVDSTARTTIRCSSSALSSPARGVGGGRSTPTLPGQTAMFSAWLPQPWTLTCIYSRTTCLRCLTWCPMLMLTSQTHLFLSYLLLMLCLHYSCPLNQHWIFYLFFLLLLLLLLIISHLGHT